MTPPRETVTPRGSALKEEAGHWLGSAVRHTWKPATAVAECLSLAGAAIQWKVSSALSLGEVFRQL